MNEPPISTESRDVEQTRRIGAGLAEICRAGDLLVLSGDLGAGKTVFAQGVARGLGVPDQVTSPTFALVQTYDGRLLLHHLDVYRLEHVNEALDLGLAEMLDDDAVVLIEWGETIAPVLPHQYLEVHLSHGTSNDRRLVDLRPVGDSWQARSRAMRALLAASNEGHG
jgi:tRNA threonylcarbamoyladenosine biosynthesis protein TsaE